MQSLASSHWADLRPLLADETPCALVPHHPISTGIGRCWVDHWPDPRVAALFAGGNLGFAGAAEALEPEALRRLIHDLLEEWDRVFIDPPDGFGPSVVAALGEPSLWPRVLYAWPGGDLDDDSESVAPSAARFRRLDASDEPALGTLGADVEWISDTFGGPAGLARSGLAWGAFEDGDLAAVAATFYLGRAFEELGVVTERAYRGRGLSTHCARALIGDILGRGRVPCWSTTPDNGASRRVAAKLGFRELRETMQFMAGAPTTGALPYDGRRG